MTLPHHPRDNPQSSKQQNIAKPATLHYIIAIMNPLLIASLIGFPLLSTALLIMQRLTPRPIAEWATHPMKQHPSLIALGLATALCSCSPAPRITVKNDSPHTLSNLVISGTGFSERLPILEPGTQHQWTVTPSSESSLGLRFDAAQRTVDSGKQGYFEPKGRYRIEAVIYPDLNVSLTTKTSWF